MKSQGETIPVAIKECDQSEYKYFVREVNSFIELNLTSPNIVQTYKIQKE